MANATKQAVQGLRKQLKKHVNLSKNPNIALTKDGAPVHDHGSQIYVYNHFLTNQVVYSLRKALDNGAALAQIPFNGKKTVPRALRKDHWQPLANVIFPSTAVGLTAFRQLREFRRLHELSWDRASPQVAVDAKTGAPLSRRERGRRLMDQKANSIADLAAVLAKLDFAQLAAAAAAHGLPDGLGEKGDVPAEVAQGKVVVRWANVYDAEFARAWPEGVVHDVWERSQQVTPRRQHAVEIETDVEQ